MCHDLRMWWCGGAWLDIQQRLLYEFGGSKATFFICAVCRQVTELEGWEQAWESEEALVKAALQRAGVYVGEKRATIKDLRQVFNYFCSYHAEYTYPYQMPCKVREDVGRARDLEDGDGNGRGLCLCQGSDHG